MLIFTTSLCKTKVVVRDESEVAEIFATSFGEKPLDKNKKECFLEFDKENKIKWCRTSFNKNNLHLLQTATIVAY